MEKLCEEERHENTRKEALEEHARLHKLFKEDRFAFERERKRMVEEVINGAKDTKQRKKLKALQESWDRKMKNAGSAHNRFVLAQHLFVEHVNKVWNPTMEECCRYLKSDLRYEG